MLNESFDSLGERSHPREWTQTSVQNSTIGLPMLNESFDFLGERSHPWEWTQASAYEGYSMFTRGESYYISLPGEPSYFEWSEGAYWLGDLPEWREVSSIPPEEHAVPMTSPERSAMNAKDKPLHDQIEDLLTALNDMQRQQADLARELQREREEKEEDRSIAVALLESLKQYSEAVREMAGGEATDDELATQKLVENAERRFSAGDAERVSILQTKHQLRDAASEWKQKHEVETSRCQELMKQLATFIWRWAKAIVSNVFVGTFLCQIIFLFLLWDLRSRRRQKWTTRRTAGKDRGKTNSWARIFPRGLLAASRVEVISGLFLLHMAVFSISSLTVELQTRFTGDVACGVALMLLFSIYCILEPYAQHI